MAKGRKSDAEADTRTRAQLETERAALPDICPCGQNLPDISHALDLAQRRYLEAEIPRRR